MQTVNQKRKEIKIGSSVRLVTPHRHKGAPYSLDHLMVRLEIPKGVSGTVVDNGVNTEQKVVRFVLSDAEGHEFHVECPVAINGIQPI
jgi:hypothetical protein